MPASNKKGSRPMNIVVKRGSHAEDKYRALGGVLNLEPEQIASGIAPTPTHDLLYHGGKTIPNLASPISTSVVMPGTVATSRTSIPPSRPR